MGNGRLVVGDGSSPPSKPSPVEGDGERGAVFVGGGVVEEDEGMGLRIREDTGGGRGDAELLGMGLCLRGDTGCRAARDGSVPSRGHGMGEGIG